VADGREGFIGLSPKRLSKHNKRVHVVEDIIIIRLGGDGVKSKYLWYKKTPTATWRTDISNAVLYTDIVLDILEITAHIRFKNVYTNKASDV